MRSKYNSEAALSQLDDQREEIEQEIGESLVWDANPQARDKTIAIHRDADLRQRGEWDGHLKWMVDMTGRFRKAFVPRVKQLNLDVVREDEPAELSVQI